MSEDAVWTDVDPPRDGSFSVTLNSSTLTTCSGKKPMSLSDESQATRQLLQLFCNVNALSSSLLLLALAAHPTGSPVHTLLPGPVFFCCISRLSPSLRWPHRRPGVPLPHVSHVPRWLLCEVTQVFEGVAVLLTKVWMFPSVFVPPQRPAGLSPADGHSQAEKRLLPGARGRLDFHIKGERFASVYVCWKSQWGTTAAVTSETSADGAVCCPQVTAMCLSPVIFTMDVDAPSLLWWVLISADFFEGLIPSFMFPFALLLLCSSVISSHAAEALLVYSQTESQLWHYNTHFLKRFQNIHILQLVFYNFISVRWWLNRVEIMGCCSLCLSVNHSVCLVWQVL